MLDDDSCRIINNQKKEHSVHAFERYGSSGLDDLTLLLQRFRDEKFPPKNLIEALDLIDKMRDTHVECASCTLKILAFSELFAYQKLQARYSFYSSEYDRWKELEIDELMISNGRGRDYRKEIWDHVRRHLGEGRWESLGLPPWG
jgi:hypothetical protein